MALASKEAMKMAEGISSYLVHPTTACSTFVNYSSTCPFFGF